MGSEIEDIAQLKPNLGALATWFLLRNFALGQQCQNYKEIVTQKWWYRYHDSFTISQRFTVWYNISFSHVSS